jgi:hypothetical protein
LPRRGSTRRWRRGWRWWRSRGQIYFDFASYAGIAIGTARLFGVRLTENFHRPLVSVSIAEFWNRWHMTLTRWFHDYVFTPLGGFRKGGGRAIVNASVVLVLCGLWHGARWNFVFWGLYHALLLTGTTSGSSTRSGTIAAEAAGEGAFTLAMGVSVAATFWLNIVSTVFFRSPDVATIGRSFRACVGLQTGAVVPVNWTLGGYGADHFRLAGDRMRAGIRRAEREWARVPWPVRAAAWGGLVVRPILLARQPAGALHLLPVAAVPAGAGAGPNNRVDSHPVF